MSRYTSAATLCVVMFASPSFAHDHAGHAKHHEHFYKNLKQPGSNVSCCNDQDCRPAPHRVTPHGVEFFVGNRWFMPPADRLMEVTTPDASGHWCGLRENTPEPHTFCAIVPRGGV